MTKPGNGAPQPRKKLGRASGLLWTGVGSVMFVAGGWLAIDNLTRNPPHFYAGFVLAVLGLILAVSPAIRRRDKRQTPGRARPNGNGA